MRFHDLRNYHRYAEEIEHIVFNKFLRLSLGQPTAEYDRSYQELLVKMRTWESQVEAHRDLLSKTRDLLSSEKKK